MKKPIVIGRPIGPAHAPFIVAELSANHLGSLARAHAIVDAAADAGCDALKLQTFTPASMTLDLHDGAFAIADGPWQGRTLWDLYDEAHTMHDQPRQHQYPLGALLSAFVQAQDEDDPPL